MILFLNLSVPALQRCVWVSQTNQRFRSYMRACKGPKEREFERDEWNWAKKTLHEDELPIDD